MRSRAKLHLDGKLPGGFSLDSLDAHRCAQIGLDRVEVREPLGSVGNDGADNRHFQRLFGFGAPFAHFA